MGMGVGMGWNKRLIFDGFRRFNGKSRHCAVRQSFSSRSVKSFYSSIISQPIFRDSNALKNHSTSIIKNPNFVATFHSKFQSQPILRNYALKNHNIQTTNPNYVIAKRFHSEFQCRRRRWYRNPWKLGGLVGLVALVYYRNLETVPYSKRRRFVIVSSSLEKKMANWFESFLLEHLYKGKILGSDHPDRIRVERVGRKIVDGMRKGFRRLGDDEDRDRLIALVDEYDWEFIVVDEPAIDNALCCFAGKIVIFTGRLKHLENDFEIADDISHEVGHAVARHLAEDMSNILWWILAVLFPSYKTDDHRGHFLWDPISRREELEADYIGFLLSASAGYDPRKMLEVYKKSYLKMDMDGVMEGCSSHPSGKTRLEQVSETKVMEEALAMYKEARKDKEKDSLVSSIFQKIMGSIF